MEALALKPGDEVELEVEGKKARLVPIKTIKVPRDQAWFWMPEWQNLKYEILVFSVPFPQMFHLNNSC